MEILIYVYFGINLFIAGYVFNENETWESAIHTFLALVFCLLFGTIAIIYVLISYAVSPILQWIICEIKFWYRFKFTDFWDKILLDDNYSEDYKSREEKLERVINIADRMNKQSKRHSKVIHNKYK